MTKPRIKRRRSPEGVWYWAVFVNGRAVAGFRNFRMLCRELAFHLEIRGQPW